MEKNYSREALLMWCVEAKFIWGYPVYVLLRSLALPIAPHTYVTKFELKYVLLAAAFFNPIGLKIDMKV